MAFDPKFRKLVKQLIRKDGGGWMPDDLTIVAHARKAGFDEVEVHDEVNRVGALIFDENEHDLALERLAMASEIRRLLGKKP